MATDATDQAEGGWSTDSESGGAEGGRDIYGQLWSDTLTVFMGQGEPRR